MKKYLLIKAAVITIIIFSIGLGMGMWLDGQRYEEIKNEINQLTIDWNDARLQAFYYETMSGQDFCQAALTSNKEISKIIFARGERLERYEKINRFSSEVLEQKKIYALLHIQLWLNSVKLKEKCGANYTTMIYFYSHYADGSEQEGQDVQSSVLVDSIHRCDGDLLVFPIPIDLEVQSVETIKDQFGITETPSILVDEQDILTGVQTEDTIKSYTGC